MCGSVRCEPGCSTESYETVSECGFSSKYSQRVPAAQADGSALQKMPVSNCACQSKLAVEKGSSGAGAQKR